MDLSTVEVVLVAALAVSEVLALVPGVKSNSVFQLVWGLLKKLKEKLPAIAEWAKKLIKAKEEVEKAVEEVKKEVEDKEEDK